MWEWLRNQLQGLLLLMVVVVVVEEEVAEAMVVVVDAGTTTEMVVRIGTLMVGIGLGHTDDEGDLKLLKTVKKRGGLQAGRQGVVLVLVPLGREFKRCC